MKSALLFLGIVLGRVPFIEIPAGVANDGNVKNLFGKLDQNADGKITDDELKDSQRPLFRRALRVADVDEDSALSPTEFLKAVTDPERVELPGVNSGIRNSSPAIASFDRDGDGMLTINEVPAPLKERFQQLLDRIQQDSVSVARVQEYLFPGNPGGPAVAPTASSITDSEMSLGKEASRDRTEVELNKKSGLDNMSKGKARAGLQKSGDARSIFSERDRDSNGKLTADEIPPRLRGNLKAADTDGDGSISSREMQAAYQRRARNQKK